LEARDQEDQSLKPAKANSSVRPYLENTQHNMRLVETILRMEGEEIKKNDNMIIKEFFLKKKLLNTKKDSRVALSSNPSTIKRKKN
jgi:hypothetical protein